MEKKRVDYYMNEIDHVMTGISDARMTLFYLDAILAAAVCDFDLCLGDVTRIKCQIRGLQENLEKYNPWSKRMIGGEA